MQILSVRTSNPSDTLPTTEQKFPQSGSGRDIKLVTLSLLAATAFACSGKAKETISLPPVSSSLFTKNDKASLNHTGLFSERLTPSSSFIYLAPERRLREVLLTNRAAMFPENNSIPERELSMQKVTPALCLLLAIEPKFGNDFLRYLPQIKLHLDWGNHGEVLEVNRKDKEAMESFHFGAQTIPQNERRPIRVVGLSGLQYASHAEVLVALYSQILEFQMEQDAHNRDTRSGIKQNSATIADYSKVARKLTEILEKSMKSYEQELTLFPRTDLPESRRVPVASSIAIREAVGRLFPDSRKDSDKAKD